MHVSCCVDNKFNATQWGRPVSLIVNLKLVDSRARLKQVRRKSRPQATRTDNTEALCYQVPSEKSANKSAKASDQNDGLSAAETHLPDSHFNGNRESNLSQDADKPCISSARCISIVLSTIDLMPLLLIPPVGIRTKVRAR
jgi:hypothetical protein